ncbi:MAG: helix-turn-helix domain-containing protein [Elusimicrobiota bacterium]|nr:helix-turn-helix domain-containing protein [Elusimicrobiota bacterium]
MKKKKKSAKRGISGPVPDVMDIKTLALYLSMGRSKIYGLIRLKRIPASRIGRQYRFSKDLVDAWLKERLIMPHETQIALFDKSGK